MTDRTPADYAIEHGEYLAAGAEHLIDSINALDYAVEMEYSDAEIAKAQEVANEARCALRVNIYEFRKRRIRALATPAPAQPEPVILKMSEWFSKNEFANVDEMQGAWMALEMLKTGAVAPAQPAPLHVANERGEGEDAKDAARYRWLRDRLPWTLMSAHGYTRMAARLPVSIKADMDEAHEMDAALDAAMASGLSAIAQALAAAPKEKP